MFLSTAFYRPPVVPEHHLVEFECRICGKRQSGRKNQKVCSGREGACRKAWQAGVSKRAQRRMREKRKKEKERGTSG